MTELFKTAWPLMRGIALLAGAVALIFVAIDWSTRAGGETSPMNSIETTTEVAIPPLDARTPAVTETATFALG